MTAWSLAQITFALGVLLLAAVPLGRYMARVYEGQPTLLGRALGPLERSLYRCERRRSRGGDGLEGATPSPCSPSTSSGFVAVYALQRLQGLLPLNPDGLGAVEPDLGVQHRGHLHHQHELAGLRRRDHDELPHPDAGADGPELRLGGDAAWRSWSRSSAGLTRRCARDDRQLLGRPDALHAVHPAAAVARPRAGAGLAGRGADASAGTPRRRWSRPRRRRDGTPVTDQQIAVGPAASQVAIKQLGTNGGGFFNANSAHPFENPTPLSNFLETARDPADPGGAVPTPSGTWCGDRRQGWALLAAMLVVLVPAILRHDGVRAGRQPGARRAGGRPARLATRSPAATWRARRCASASPTRPSWAAATTAASNGSVNSMHDSLHAARRAGAAGPDAARRGDLRRRRLGPLRDAGVRDRRGLHRRADGRPHAGVPGQEDRGVRDEDGRARHPRDAAGGARRHRARGAAPAGTATHRQPRAARLQRGALRLLLGRQQQRQRVRGPRRQHALLQHDCWAWRCSSAASSSAIPCSRSPARSRARRSSPPAPGTLPTHTPLFVGCWSASSSSWGR